MLRHVRVDPSGIGDHLRIHLELPVIIDAPKQQPRVLGETMTSHTSSGKMQIPDRVRSLVARNEWKRVHELPHPECINTHALANEGDLVRKRNIDVPVGVLHHFRHFRGQRVGGMSRGIDDIGVQLHGDFRALLRHTSHYSCEFGDVEDQAANHDPLVGEGQVEPLVHLLSGFPLEYR